MSMWLRASIYMSSAKSRSPSDSVNVHKIMIPLLTPMYVLFIIKSFARQNRMEIIYTLALHKY